jgi:hypothetical protein
MAKKEQPELKDTEKMDEVDLKIARALIHFSVRCGLISTAQRDAELAALEGK